MGNPGLPAGGLPEIKLYAFWHRHVEPTTTSR
jgi:hypothetical protein